MPQSVRPTPPMARVTASNSQSASLAHAGPELTHAITASAIRSVGVAHLTSLRFMPHTVHAHDIAALSDASTLARTNAGYVLASRRPSQLRFAKKVGLIRLQNARDLARSSAFHSIFSGLG
jgi:hypothetical protein